MKRESAEDELENFDEEELAELEKAMEMGVFEEILPKNGKNTIRYVGPYIPEWKIFVKEEQVLNFVQEFGEIEQKESLNRRTIYFQTSSVSRDGKVLIEFNQKI